MTTSQEQRDQCAQSLLANADRVGELSAFVGLDGFVDEILHVVDKRQSAEEWTRLPKMDQWGDRIKAAAGRSTNIEVVPMITKLGGNGPIMANALASLGLRVSYLGLLGYPEVHQVFADFMKRADVHSIAEPGYTYAVEFEDGKVMVGKHESLKEMNWGTIKSRFGLEKFEELFRKSDLVGFVNWTMLPYMSEIWAAIQKELCGSINGERRTLFVDLADPEKRLNEDVAAACELIVGFNQHFDVTLGLNEKETHEVAKALGIDAPANSPAELIELGREIHRRVPVQTLLIHPVEYAFALSGGQLAQATGPTTDNPKITTGAGDHFNSGFCLAKLLGLDNLNALLTGVTTSGYYVRTGASPGIKELAGMLQDPAVAY